MQSLETIFGLVRREVWIVTAATAERRGGLLATWVQRASLTGAAPTVSIAIAKNHFTRELIDDSGAFAVHLITAAQVELAWRFALGSGRDRDKLAGLDYATSAAGSPLLSDCLAQLDCQVYDRYDGGDRVYYWGDVLAGAQGGSGEPLTDHELIALASDEQKAALRRDMAADVEIQRSLLTAWRASRG